MEDFLKAFITFLTDILAAISEFVGGSFALGDIAGSLDGILGGEGEAEGEGAEAPVEG